MPLTVKWDEGIIVECANTKLVFDPPRNNHLYPHIFITHTHLDHSGGFTIKYLLNYLGFLTGGDKNFKKS